MTFTEWDDEPDDDDVDREPCPHGVAFRDFCWVCDGDEDVVAPWKNDTIRVGGQALVRCRCACGCQRWRALRIGQSDKCRHCSNRGLSNGCPTIRRVVAP